MVKQKKRTCITQLGKIARALFESKRDLIGSHQTLLFIYQSWARISMCNLHWKFCTGSLHSVTFGLHQSEWSNVFKYIISDKIRAWIMESMAYYLNVWLSTFRLRFRNTCAVLFGQKKNTEKTVFCGDDKESVRREFYSN